MNSSNPIQNRRCPQILFIRTSKNMDYPFTVHGFTSGNNGRLGVPEWYVGKGKYATIEDGSELWEVYSNGQEVLRAVFKDNKFHAIK